MNYGWIWFMGEYDLCVNINDEWIWVTSEYELWVNINIGGTHTQPHI